MQWQASGTGSNLSCCAQDVPPCQFLYSTYGWRSIHQVCQMSVKSYRHKKAQRNNCGAIARCGAWHLCRLCATACDATVSLSLCGWRRREDSCERSPTVAYADAFGAAGAGGTLTYYLASAFDKVGLTRHVASCCSHAFLARSRQLQVTCASRAVHLQVYMQPSGLLSISGLASSTPFLRDFFAHWKVRPFFVAREEYKNVANQFTQVCGTPHSHPCT